MSEVIPRSVINMTFKEGYVQEPLVLNYPAVDLIAVHVPLWEAGDPENDDSIFSWADACKKCYFSYNNPHRSSIVFQEDPGTCCSHSSIRPDDNGNYPGRCNAERPEWGGKDRKPGYVYVRYWVKSSVVPLAKEQIMPPKGQLSLF